MNADTAVSANYNQAGITSITVSPATATIGTLQQFTATVNGNGSFSQAVTWSLTCPACGALSPGTLTSSGLYDTPYPAPPSVVITATSTQTPSISGSATVTLTPPPASTGPALSVDARKTYAPHQPGHLRHERVEHDFHRGQIGEPAGRSLGWRCHVAV
jgi:hypothetical protein